MPAVDTHDCRRRRHSTVFGQREQSGYDERSQTSKARERPYRVPSAHDTWTGSQTSAHERTMADRDARPGMRPKRWTSAGGLTRNVQVQRIRCA